MADYQLFINGEFSDAASGETFATYNPGTGQKLADLPKAGRDDAVRAIEAARKAFDEGPWPTMSGAERAAKMRRIVELINENAAELAELEALDGGGTILKAQMADVPGATSAFEWFAKMAEEQPDRVELPGSPVPGVAELPALRAHRCVHGRHPLELPADHGRVEDRPGDRRRQHLGAEAGVAHLAQRSQARRRSSPRPTCPRAWSTSSPAPAAPSARSWPPTRWSTRPRSPGRPRSVDASCSWPRAP